jgi:hypothetical protein
MHQSFTLLNLSSPASCLLGRDTYGSHYGAHTEANMGAGFSIDIKAAVKRPFRVTRALGGQALQ